jgi:hypothetical protein
VPVSGCCFGDRSVGGALGRKLSPVLSRRAFLYRGNHRAHRFAAKLAQPAQSAPRQHGPVIHSHADRILCRQWQEPATVEGTPTVGFLGLASRRRGSDHHVRNVEASPHASTGGALTAFTAEGYRLLRARRVARSPLRKRLTNSSHARSGSEGMELIRRSSRRSTCP